MKAEDQNRNLPDEREEEAPAEPRYRRVQQVASPSGRVLPGMPPDLEEDEDDDLSCPGKPRFTRTFEPHGPWWRPSGSWGRALLATGALVAATGLGVASFALHNFLAHDARFRISGLSNIEADGLSEVSRADVMPIFGEDIGRNIFFVRLNERRQQLEQIPWVEKATVIRLLPDHLRIQVVERKPIAFVRQGSQIGLVDANGILLNMPPAMMAQRHYSFPVVTGISAKDAIGDRRQRMATFSRLIQELDADGKGISKQISEIDLSDAEDARVMLPDAQDEILAHFGEDHFRERYQRYQDHILAWRAQYPRLASVDLRYEDQMFLTMKSDAPVESATNLSAAAPVAPQASASARETTVQKPAAKPAASSTEAKKTLAAAATTGKTGKASAHTAKATAAGSKSNAKAAKKKDPKALRVAEKSSAQKHTDGKASGGSSRHRASPLRPALDPVLGQ